MGCSDVLLQRVDVSKHVWAVVTVERCDVGELQQGESCCCCAYSSSAGTVSFAHMFVEVIECWKCVEAELTRMALLGLVGMYGL